VTDSSSPEGAASREPERDRRWTFLTNHAHVLICIARDPEIRLKDAADRVGITERAAQAILADLVQANYVTRERVGRRNRYRVNASLPLRHEVEHSHLVGELLELLTPDLR